MRSLYHKHMSITSCLLDSPLSSASADVAAEIFLIFAVVMGLVQPVCPNGFYPLLPSAPRLWAMLYRDGVSRK